MKILLIILGLVLIFTGILLVDLEIRHVQVETSYRANSDWIVFEPIDCYTTAQVFDFKGKPLTGRQRVWEEKCPPAMHIKAKEG